MTNPYETSAVTLGQAEFLTIAYTRMRTKVRRLIEIEELKVRGKLSLPLIKEKFDITRNVLQAVGILQNDIKDIENNMELADILAEIGFQISFGNVGIDKETAMRHYGNAVIVLDCFLETPKA